MSDDFYPVPELDGSPPPARGYTPTSGTPWLARLGLVVGSLGLAFGIGAFGAGQFVTAEHEPAVTTSTQGSGQAAAPAQQPAAPVPAPAGEGGEED